PAREGGGRALGRARGEGGRAAPHRRRRARAGARRGGAAACGVDRAGEALPRRGRAARAGGGRAQGAAGGGSGEAVRAVRAPFDSAAPAAPLRSGRTDGGAATLAAAIRARLAEAGVAVRPFASP